MTKVGFLAGSTLQDWRSLSPSLSDDDARRCAHCNDPLPIGSRPYRRYCSTSCRVSQWDRDNPRRGYEAEPAVRLHWHTGTTTLLSGHYTAGYWRGPEGCPPECPGLKPPYTSSAPVPEGCEGLPPLTAGTRRETAATDGNGRGSAEVAGIRRRRVCR